MNQPRNSLGFSRRQLLKYSGLGAAAVAGSSFLAACGGDDERRRWRRWWAAELRRHPDPRRHRWRQQGHARPARAGHRGRHRAVQQPLRAPAVLEQQLRARAGAGRVGRGVRGRHDVDDQDAPGRHLPQRPDRSRPTTPGSASSAWPTQASRSRPAGQLSRSSTSSPPRSSTTPRSRWCSRRRTRSSTRCWPSTPSGIIPGGEFDPANPVGTGAFAYKSFEAGKTSTFTKYADYWGDAAFVDELQIQDFADDNAKVNALQAGQIQTLDNLPYNLVDTIKGAGGGVLIAEGGQWVPFTMRVDPAPFNDVKVRQAMRLIVDRQAMIDQTLSGYGSLGNDLYAPARRGVRQRPAPARAGHRPGQVAAPAGRPGGAPGRAVHRRRHRLGGRPGREPLRRAGQGGRGRGQGHEEDAFYDDDYLSYTFAQDFWNTRNYIPQAVVGTFPENLGGTYNETHWDNEQHRDLVNQAAAGARRGQAGRPAPPGAGDRVQRGRPDHLGLPSAGRRLRRQRAGVSSRASTSRSATTSSTRCRSEMTTGRDSPRSARGGRTPRGRSGAAAWAIWLLRRIGLAVLSLWLVSVLVFLATAALGDPVRAILGRDYDSNPGRRGPARGPARRRRVARRRYFDWLGGLLTGDLGTSLANQQPVWGQISSNVVNTLVLVFLAAIVMIPLAFGIAMISAHYRRQAARHRHPDDPPGAGRHPRVRDRHPARRDLLDHGVPHLPGGHDHHAERAPVGQPQGHGAAGRDPGAGGDAVRVPDRAGHPARGAGQRLRRAGPAQGHPRAGGDAQARAAQRDRARHPGHRAPAGLAGRRRRPGRDALRLPGHRAPARRLGPQPRRADGAGTEHDHRRRSTSW